MSIFVERIPNKPIDSNSFVVYTNKNESCLIIDPGTEDSANLIDFIEKKQLQPEFIFLTHEHFDHIWGVVELKKRYDCKLVVSKKCNEKIVDKKKNMSIFFNQIGFELLAAEILVEEINYVLDWYGNIIKFYLTPGHSAASISFEVDNYLFVGDLIVPYKKTVTKLPTGNKIETIDSMHFILKNFEKNKEICPGHGLIFSLKDLNITNHL